MSGRFVRASKYRHVFGRPTKKEQCYDNLRISKNAWDTNLIKANPEYLSVNWEASGGGAFAVIPLSERGKLPERIPLFRGHTAAVLDTDWSPFNDSLVASGSDDGKVFIWTVPQDFTIRPDVKSDDIQDIAPVAKLTGHSRKVGHVLFNPSANNVLASSSGDYTVKLWDVEAQQSKLTLKHADIVQSLSWSGSGSLLVTTCRDKKLRVWDVRQENAVVETGGHTGAKNSRAVWMGEHDRIATTGFSKMSDRQLALWDIKAPREPIDGFTILDQISGICMPFWDDGNQILYLAGKGDGNIRYYEYQNDKLEYLSQHTSTEPQRGIAFLPKRGVDTHENEITRAFKTIDDRLIEPISFIVPRRAEVFQDDIYPPCVGTKPSMSSAEYFAGKEGLPPKISLASLHDGQVPEEITRDYKPSAVTASPVKPTPAKTVDPTPAPKPEPAAAAPVTRGPPPSMKDNQASIATMASKFADKDDDEESDNETSSSFEEVIKPTTRATTSTSTSTTTAASKPTPSSSSSSSTTLPPKTSLNPSTAPDPPTSTITAPSPKPASQPPSSSTPRTVSSSGEITVADLAANLRRIGDLVEAQTVKIDALTAEVEKLKTVTRNNGASTSGSGGDRAKDEKIRMLELELESLRGD